VIHLTRSALALLTPSYVLSVYSFPAIRLGNLGILPTAPTLRFLDSRATEPGTAAYPRNADQEAFQKIEKKTVESFSFFCRVSSGVG